MAIPPAERTAASFGRLVLVRLFAFALLIGVTSLFIDYPALIRDASRSASPVDLSALPIDVGALGAGATVRERRVTGDANARELAVVVEGVDAEWRAPGYDGTPRAVLAHLFDAGGAEIGAQQATLELEGVSSVLRLVFTPAVRVGRIVVVPVR